MSAWLPAPVLLAAVPGGKPQSPPALGPYLDTLLPGDGSPSATDLGLENALMARLDDRPRMARLVELGCAWLDRQAARSGVADFAGLDEDGRVALVKFAEQANRRALPGAFFANTLDLAFQEYYSRPEIWERLGFRGPPQPFGYPDHESPPGVAL